MAEQPATVHAWGMQTDEHTTTAPGDAQPGAPLRRDPDGKVVAGVCAGLGRHFGIDPIIFRIGFVALTLAGAAGVALYGLAWLLVPEVGHQESIASRLLHSRPTATHIGAWALVVIAAVVLFGSWADRNDDGGLVIALILGGAAVALLSSRSTHRPPTPPGAPPTGEVPPPAEAGGTATSQMWPAAVPATAAARSPRRPRSPLGRITISLLSILGGVVLLLDRTGAADVTLAAYLSLSLVVVGVALVAGAWRGRSRGLILLGVLLAGPAATATVVDVPLGAGVGERTFRPAGAAELAPSYRLAVGELTLDLREAAPAPGQLEVVTAKVGLGHLVVLLPKSAAVVVDGRVGVGELDVLARSEDGTNVRYRSDEPATAEGAGRIELRVSAGAGQVEVLR